MAPTVLTPSSNEQHRLERRQEAIIEMKTRGNVTTFMGNLIAVLSFIVIGYPLPLATITTMLLGWIVTGVAMGRVVLGHGDSAPCAASWRTRIAGLQPTLQD